jgi:hypothetical protein
MSKSAVFGAYAAILVGSAVSGALPAAAGDWHHREAVEIVPYGHVYRVPWYDQHPWIGTGPGYYYSHHPDHIPAYPKPLTGYPVPIYDVGQPVVHAVPRHRVGAHAEWCAARYRSYDVGTDTYQPFDGPRRYCRSPYG